MIAHVPLLRTWRLSPLDETDDEIRDLTAERDEARRRFEQEKEAYRGLLDEVRDLTTDRDQLRAALEAVLDDMDGDLSEDVAALAHKALRFRSPSAPAKGVPHGDRERYKQELHRVWDERDSAIAENARMSEQVRALQNEIEALDARLSDAPSTTVDEDGFITGYRMPVGPWHRIIALSRVISTGRAESSTSLPLGESHVDDPVPADGLNP